MNWISLIITIIKLLWSVFHKQRKEATKEKKVKKIQDATRILRDLDQKL